MLPARSSGYSERNAAGNLQPIGTCSHGATRLGFSDCHQQLQADNSLHILIINTVSKYLEGGPRLQPAKLCNPPDGIVAHESHLIDHKFEAPGSSGALANSYSLRA